MWFSDAYQCQQVFICFLLFWTKLSYQLCQYTTGITPVTAVELLLIYSFSLNKSKFWYYIFLQQNGNSKDKVWRALALGCSWKISSCPVSLITEMQKGRKIIHPHSGSQKVMNHTLSLKYNEIAWHEVFMQYENSASLISISDRLKCKYFQCNKSSLKQTTA